MISKTTKLIQTHAVVHLTTSNVLEPVVPDPTRGSIVFLSTPASILALKALPEGPRALPLQRLQRPKSHIARIRPLRLLPLLILRDVHDAQNLRSREDIGDACRPMPSILLTSHLIQTEDEFSCS
jgi:hypothetical protein